MTDQRKPDANERMTAIIIRNVPESVRRGLKAAAAAEGKTMQKLVTELIVNHISK